VASRIDIPATYVRSLAWRGDELVDWVAGGATYRLDGSHQYGKVNYAYRFNAAATSPSGRFVALYEHRGTKAILLDNGQILRELNRSFYRANDYLYPITMFERDGRTLLVHCPERFDQLHIEDVETGELLTARPDESAPPSAFHSRLAVDPAGRWLLSAGWVWHPWDFVSFYDLDACLDGDPAVLDSMDGHCAGSRHVGLVEEASAAWLSNGLLLVGAGDEDADPSEMEEENPALQPDGFVVYDVNEDEVVAQGNIGQPPGQMMAVDNDHFVAFLRHPRLIRISDASVVNEWPDINCSGNQQSSICRSDKALPPIIATDTENGRFAVVDGEQIKVVTGLI